MTQLKPFRETMTEIASVFGFHDIQLDDACHLSRKFLITNSLVGGHIGLVKNGPR